MNWKDSYNDICNELRILQIHEMELRKRVELAHAVVVSGEIPSSGSYCHVPLDKSLGWFDSAVADLDRVQAEVDRVHGVKIQMEQHMSSFTGLAHVIQHKRMVEGKTYRQMSTELGYSEQYLREVSSKRTNKKPTKSANAS